MDIRYLFYTFLCIIAFIYIICHGNSKSILKKESKFYRKLLRLKLRTRILVLILAWMFSTVWIVIAYKYDYKGISILGMMPFVIVRLGVVNIPIWEYLRNKILKSSYSNSIKEWLNFFNTLLMAYLVFVAFFVIGASMILVRSFHLI